MNPYIYGWDDPVTMTDPEGLSPTPMCDGYYCGKSDSGKGRTSVPVRNPRQMVAHIIQINETPVQPVYYVQVTNTGLGSYGQSLQVDIIPRLRPCFEPVHGSCDRAGRLLDAIAWIPILGAITESGRWGLPSPVLVIVQIPATLALFFFEETRAALIIAEGIMSITAPLIVARLMQPLTKEENSESGSQSFNQSSAD